MDVDLPSLWTPVAPVVAALATLALANRHAAKLARESHVASAEAARAQRSFESRERRYEDRREAVIAFDEEVRRDVQKIDEHEAMTGLSPGDTDEDYAFTSLIAAHARVEMLASSTVSAAGEVLVQEVRSAFNGTGDRESLNAAILDYRRVARSMLAEEPEERSVSRSIGRSRTTPSDRRRGVAE